MKKNLIVFDIDGTLTDSVSIHHAAFINGLTQLGLKAIDTNFADYLHHTDAHIAKVIYEKAFKQPFNSEKETVLESLMLQFIKKQPQIESIKNAANIVQQIERDTDYGVCFATGSFSKPAVYKLQQIGVKYSPLQLVAANGLESREGIVLKAIANAQQHYQVTKFKHIISIGDGLWDLKTAQNLKLDFIGIGQKNKAILIQNGAMRHMNDFIDFELLSG